MRLTVLLGSVALALAASCDDGNGSPDAATNEVAKPLGFVINGCVALPQSGPLDCISMTCPETSTPPNLVELDLKETLTGAAVGQVFGCSCRSGTSTNVHFDYIAFKVQIGSETLSGEHLEGRAAVTGPQDAADLDSCPTPANGARADLYAAFYGKAKIKEASAGLARFQGGAIYYAGRSNYYHAA